jgi:hypothetical protein
MYYKATIEVLIEVNDGGEACDAIAEGLRPLLKAYAECPSQTAWIDWRYAPEATFPDEHDGSGFELAEAK